MKRSTIIKMSIAGCIAVFCAVLAFRGTGDEEGLFLYCGAGIRPAVEDLRAEFTEQTGIPVQVTYAGSGCLLSMLTFAKSGDLYMPGERYYLDQAREQGHVCEDDVVGYFVAVITVQKGNPKNILTLEDLARPDVRVGIGRPDSVACGLIAQQILEKAGLWEAVKKNIDAGGGEMGTAVELTNAMALNALDAAINWDAMAFPVRDQVDIIAIPRERNIDVEIPLALLAWSRQKPEARRFIEFAASDAGQRHFVNHGYHTSLEPYVLPYYGNVAAQ